MNIQKNNYLDLSIKIHSTIDSKFENYINENRKYIFNNKNEYEIISETLLNENYETKFSDIDLN